MEKITKYQITKFSIIILFFGLVSAALWLQDGFTTAIHIMLLTWSLFILCIPANHGNTIIGIPITFFSKKQFVHAQVITISFAALLNVFTYFIIPAVYFSTILTHLLLRIISNPWPYWSIIAVCCMGSMYKSLVGTKHFHTKKLIHYSIRTVIMISGLFMFLYFSYKELIILLNVRAG